MFLPAIDLMGGKCVRLFQGEKAKKTQYSDRPQDTARAFESQGADRLHVVDLDGAFNDGGNRQCVRDIVAAVSIPVQVGGGIRTLEDVRTLFGLGASSVIFGTAAVKDPGLVGAALSQYGPDRIYVGIDAKGGRVAVRGWVETTDADPLSLARDIKAAGVKTVIYTDISRDGALCGPNIEATRRLALETGLSVIASGGIQSLDDLRSLLTLEPSGVTGIISGRAVYEGKFTVAQAVETLRKAAAS